ncbi:beta-mannosidase [Arachidicoccus ginsenosidimutans]|uniref:discoidin domain-containing protein n=1 Tax=Arachidicoccus sp. BS20 TaxID=1850526 RepID=UPI0007F12B54|nr:discoidin domain-containing protein [Arachidicoccus sp. BS20]ANI88333.1 beta-mannosidase [Arachidicoccus sp. BS20]ANI88339.1 beta-mannosidase [Arachidicoccus sp. BS20]
MAKVSLSVLKFLFFFITSSSLSYVKAQSVYSLDSSSDIIWKVCPQSDVHDSTQLFSDGYNTSEWVKGVVPGTVFNAYVVAGKEEDPNFGDNIYRVDKSKYDRNFWYRTEFEVPGSFTKEKIWLNFEGVNRKGEIFLNGRRIGELSGIVQRGKFDITALVKRDRKNILAVLISIPEKPLNNYGSPTYLSSAGWDWMPYVPGLNSGITDDVYLSNTGSITLEDPWIKTALPTNARADLSVQFNVHNSASENREAIIEGVIQPGDIHFSKKINIEAGRSNEFVLDKSQFPQLSINQPKLWWPNGYGKPNLYTCEFVIKSNNEVSDSQKVTFGIKRYSYDTVGGVLHVSVNGKKVFIKGGDWGMSEYMLRCRGKEYDTKVRLHKEMNFNMIRNWLGSTTDEEFYEACDKYGIMVWDDFWLNANPNLPSDIHVFNANVIEKIKRERNHPSIAIWCGDNEGWPVAPLNNWIREDIAVYDGGSRHYQPNSHAENLTGSGVWGNQDPKWYFTPYPLGFGGSTGWGLRTEIGTAVFPNFESFKKFMPKDKWWPRNEMWNQHFFGQNAFNATPDNYDKFITERYGVPSGIEDYCRKAQLLNIETNKAMYEGWEDHMWEDASGVMTWMSQSAYPSMVWQTYDYYYDLTGAYWGVKEACKPLHIQWNPLTNEVKIINTTGRDADRLTAEIKVYNPDGKEVKKFSSRVNVFSPANTAVSCFTIPFYAEQRNVALGKPTIASSTDGGSPSDVTDGNPGSRWASKTNDNQWIYIDLQQPQNINRVVFNWEDAYAKKFKVQVSDDALNWKDVAISEGKIGLQTVYFNDVNARYVRMLGIERATGWGYSLWSFDVYGGNEQSEGLANVHFIKLTLKDKDGKSLDENFYWRGNKNGDFTMLNQMARVKLKISSKIERRKDSTVIHAIITNPVSSKSIAFAIRMQVLNSKTEEQVLPAIFSDDYFSLLPGELRQVDIKVDNKCIKGISTGITAVPYNSAH